MMFHFTVNIKYYAKKKVVFFFYAMKKLGGLQEEDSPLYRVWYLPYGLC